MLYAYSLTICPEPCKRTTPLASEPGLGFERSLRTWLAGYTQGRGAELGNPGNSPEAAGWVNLWRAPGFRTVKF